nr:MAG TPA: hypothetical protein [Caudoviricetes sp.]
MPACYILHSINPIMKTGYLRVEVSPVSPGIIADTLNLPLKPLNAARLIGNTLPESTHGVSKNIHLLSQVIESHIKVISQVDGVVVVYPFRGGFGGVRSPRNMDTHAVQALFSQLLLALQLACQASHQCSQ